ncbi:DUF3068 domain-containing protein [Actinomadura viridis]|uniref:DUF3068 domain-containing protein n=1 Tax=Actinomadura viridis TaxID=58110 RepID=A0A931GGW4_9ACTN|nr:DUF3068 domain-containing protein [Actinomadura viridis]MBG6086780.1 hypothetical protein [Actinomadura viridis]
MRRPAGLILVCLGAFFLTLAPLVRFYVADRVVLAPLNRYQVTRLKAEKATYFDAATLKTRKGVSLEATNTVRGDVRANGGDDRIAVWDSSTNIVDTANPDKPIQIQGYRMAFDRRTSVLVNCCGSNADGDTKVRMTGYGLLFPLANVRRRDYPFYDMTTRQSVPMRYQGEERVRGMRAYRFVQKVPNTKTAALDTKVPGRMLGLGARSRDQKVDRYSEATITVWVDPRTGIPVKHRQTIHSTVRTPDGRGRMTVAKADLVTVEASQKALVAMADASALKIGAVRTYVPVGSAGLGLFLLLTGAITGLGGGRRRGEPAPRRSDGRFGDPSASAPPAQAR